MVIWYTALISFWHLRGKEKNKFVNKSNVFCWLCRRISFSIVIIGGRFETCNRIFVSIWNWEWEKWSKTILNECNKNSVCLRWLLLVGELEELTILRPLLTTFIVSRIFETAGSVGKNWFKLKSNLQVKLSFSKSLINMIYSEWPHFTGRWKWYRRYCLAVFGCS